MKKELFPLRLYPQTKANLQFGWISILLDSNCFAHTEVKHDDTTIVITIYNDETLYSKFFDEK